MIVRDIKEGVAVIQRCRSRSLMMLRDNIEGVAVKYRGVDPGHP